jgi:FkbM family methyltransferase
MRDRRFRNQALTKVMCGNYEIEAPKEHLLMAAKKTQPYRDLFVGIAARFLSEKYPTDAIIDVGANIGDTAAIIATYSRARLILVEPSDYYYEILARNTKLFPNEVTLIKAMISDGTDAGGSLHHWGGTAEFKANDDSKDNKTTTKRLIDIVDGDTCFVKTDTDGFDFCIILDSLTWLKDQKPGYLFEDWFRNGSDLIAANQVCAKLIDIGYIYFIVWDDAGFHLLSTTSLDTLVQLHHYLFKVSENGGTVRINNYDILCLHQRDEDIYKKISAWFAAN